MTKRFFIALFAISLLAISALAQERGPEATFSKMTHDFGTIKEAKGPVSCSFEFTNTGDKPLLIINAVASCGCTVPTYSDKPIAPGKTGQIKVTYNGKGRVFGPFSKVITVMTNAKTKMTRLSIKGEMVEEKQ